MTFWARSVAIRVGGIAVAMVLVAILAAELLSPTLEIGDPVPVGVSEVFSPSEIERASDYRDGQRWLFFAGLAIEVALLAFAASGRSARLRRGFERLGRRPILGAAATGAAIALATAIATLPTRLISHERAVDVGLSTQGLGSWLWDVARSAAITALLTAIGVALLMALVRRFPRAWWTGAAAGVAALAVVFTWIAPVVLAPVFNDFEPLADSSKARAEVLELGERAGVEIGEVYRVDASRRVSSLNAYVDGIGSSKRVVLYDNLLEAAARAELRSVVAHELGHVANDDIRRGILYVVIVAPLGMLFVRELGGALVDRAGADPGSPAAVPAYLLAITVAVFVLNVPGNSLSREIERGADEFALELTDDPAGLIALQKRLARANLSDPDPPGWATDLLATHPTTLERIGSALTFADEEGKAIELPPVSETSRP